MTFEELCGPIITMRDVYLRNGFCATGEGGGIDNTCGGGGGSGGDGGGDHLTVIKELHDSSSSSIDPGKIDGALSKLGEQSKDKVAEVFSKFMPREGDDKSVKFWSKEAKRLSKDKMLKEIRRKITSTYQTKKDNEI